MQLGQKPVHPKLEVENSRFARGMQDEGLPVPGGEHEQKRLRAVEGRSIGLCKLRIVLDVLEESGLANCSYVKGFDLAELMILPFSGKINLDDSQILKRLKEHA